MTSWIADLSLDRIIYRVKAISEPRIHRTLIKKPAENGDDGFGDHGELRSISCMGTWEFPCARLDRT